MKIDGQIEAKLKPLKLTGMLQTLSGRLKQAQDSNCGYLGFLMTLLEEEYERRQARSLLKRLKKQGLRTKRPLRGSTSLSIPNPGNEDKTTGNLRLY